MKGINGLFAATNYGGHYVVVEGIDFGIEIVGQTDEARQNRAFYVRKVNDDSFIVSVVFTKYAEYKEFSDWMLFYGMAASGDASAYPPMRVIIPSHEFDKFGIPKTGVTYGDDMRLNSWHMQISFQGARDPASFADQSFSIFVAPTADVVHAQYFYPSGVQLAGDQAGQDDVFYDIPAKERAPWERTPGDILGDVLGRLG